MVAISDKHILVAGGTGMIGRYLVDLLVDLGAHVRVVSRDNPTNIRPDIEFIQMDLMHLNECMRACDGMDMVFNLMGIKGSPAMSKQKPASFFVPTLLCSVNLMEAARRNEVKNYLFTSSIGVYNPTELLKEDDVWKTFPSEHDKYPGWAKRISELQADVYRIEYGWNNISIVRPANVYGRYDNFDPANAMVIPSLIRRVINGENPLVVWGDGSCIRDFIHAKDVARGMVLAVEKECSLPINLGSGTETTIKQIVEIILSCFKNKPQVIWDTSKPTGDAVRLMDISRAQSILGFQCKTSLEEGISDTVNWYMSHGTDEMNGRYNVFVQGIEGKQNV
jgi:GDP-L-fucose synthase